jgi:transcriptional regulator with XRE-family HTH domain
MNSASIYREFGAKVRKSRNAVELTQDVLAERVGLSRTSITNIESGRQKILLHQFFLLAEALSVSPQALLPTTQPKKQIEQALPKDLSRKDKDLILRIIESENIDVR